MIKINRKKSRITVVGLVCFFVFTLILSVNSHALAAPPPPYVYYEGGDGTSNWKVMDRTVPLIPPAVDPAGATITEVFDGTKGHDVLRVDGNGLNNSFRLTTHGDPTTYDCNAMYRHDTFRSGCIENAMQKELTIQIRASAMFYIYLYVDTPESLNYSSQSQSYNQFNDGVRVLEFSPTNAAPSSTVWGDPERRYYSWSYNDHYASTYDTSGSNWSQGETYHFGLGADKMDGSWHTLTIDYEEEARRLEPGIDEAVLRGIEIRGDARIDRISVDWMSEELDLYENFNTDPDWAYDTGWLDTHNFGENSTGKVDCLPQSGGYEDDCTTLDEAIPSCKSIIRDKKAVMDVDLSDLPQAQMDDCYVMLMAGYTWKDSLREGTQDHEDLMVEVEAGATSTSSVILDPGEGMLKVMTADPLTLIRGVNRMTFRSPGFCSHGHSIHFGYATRAGVNPFGFEYQSNKTFRIQCGAGPNALNLDMSANPQVINAGNTSTIDWTSNNAKTCTPLGGYFDGVGNDWQDMAPTWLDLQTGNPTWPDFSSSFLTNPLPESVNYTLNCENVANDKYITRSAKVSVLGACYNLANCIDFGWDRVRSRNDAGDNYKHDDPLGHPATIAEIDAGNNIVAAPAADSDVAFEAAYNLAPGAHRLDIHARETGAFWDKIIITNDLDYVPTDDNLGYGVNGVAGGKTKIEIEGESANYLGSSHLMLRPSKYNASGLRSRLVNEQWPYGTDYIVGLSSAVDGDPSDHLYYFAGYDFNVPAGDYYTVWVRFSSKEAADADSVWFAMDPSMGTDHPTRPNNRYDFILWDFPSIVNCCVDFDFAAKDPSSGLPSNAITVKTGDPFDLEWMTGNIHSVLPTMGTGDYDDQWVGAAFIPKDFSEVAIVPNPPNPIYHSQTLIAPAIGTYVYELQGYYGDGDFTEKKFVTVDVTSAIPPNIPPDCGHVCNQETCLEPQSGFCASFNTMLNYVETASGWAWDCQGTDGNITHCDVERNCGWKERT